MTIPIVLTETENGILTKAIQVMDESRLALLEQGKILDDLFMSQPSGTALVVYLSETTYQLRQVDAKLELRIKVLEEITH